MKTQKLLLWLAVISIGLLCFNRLAAAVVPAPVEERPLEIKVFSGKVESIILGDAAAGTMTQIVLVDEKGRRLNMEVKPDTEISDKNGDKISLDKIKQGDKVVIEYKTTKETIEEAESITLSGE